MLDSTQLSVYLTCMYLDCVSTWAEPIQTQGGFRSPLGPHYYRLDPCTGYCKHGSRYLPRLDMNNAGLLFTDPSEDVFTIKRCL